MTEPPRKPPIDPVDYRDGNLDLPLRRRQVRAFVAGTALACLAIIVAGANWSLSNIYYAPTTRPTTWQTNRLNWRGPLNCSLLTVIVLLVIATIALRSGRRAFAVGVLVGFGVMSLIEGVCFLSSWR